MDPNVWHKRCKYTCWWVLIRGGNQIVFFFSHCAAHLSVSSLQTEASIVLVVHTCNPSNLGGWDWEDGSSKPDWANSLPVSKITRAKWTGGVAQAAECLLCKHKALSPQTHQR
jgi:hypothetical protein